MSSPGAGRTSGTVTLIPWLFPVPSISPALAAEQAQERGSQTAWRGEYPPHPVP